MEAPHISPTWLRRLRISAISFFAAAALFGALGFFAGPPIAHSLLTKILAEQLHRPVTLGAIHINPYAMSVRVDGLKVGDGKGGEVFAFDQLVLDVDIASVIHAAPVVEEFRLVGPRIHVARVAPGRYDISDLLDEWLKPSDKPTPSFSVNNIKITGGRVDFDDQPVGKQHAVTDINLALPFVSNLAYQANVYTEPAFSAVINGAPLKLDGKSKPFSADRESELKLELDRFELASYLAYLPFPLPFTIAGGQVDTDLTLVFRQPPKEAPSLNLAGRVTLSGLHLLEDGKAPLLNLDKLDVPLAAVAPLNNRFQFGEIGIDGLEIFVRTGRDGSLNWQALARKMPGGDAAASPGKTDKKAKASAPGKAAPADAAAKTAKTDKAQKTAEPKPMELALGGLRLDKAVLRWQDAQGREAGPSATLERFAVKDIKVDAPKRHRDRRRCGAERPGPFGHAPGRRTDRRAAGPHAQAGRRRWHPGSGRAEAPRQALCQKRRKGRGPGLAGGDRQDRHRRCGPALGGQGRASRGHANPGHHPAKPERPEHRAQDQHHPRPRPGHQQEGRADPERPGAAHAPFPEAQGGPAWL